MEKELVKNSKWFFKILFLNMVIIFLCFSCKSNQKDVVKNKYFKDIYFSEIEDINFYYNLREEVVKDNIIKREVPISSVSKKMVFNCMQTAVEVQDDKISKSEPLNLDFVTYYVTIIVDKKEISYEMFYRSLFHVPNYDYYLKVNDACYKFFANLYKDHAEKLE